MTDMRTVIAYVHCMLDAPAEYPEWNEALKAAMGELEMLWLHGTGVSDKARAGAAIRALCRIWNDPDAVDEEWTSPQRQFYARHEFDRIANEVLADSPRFPQEYEGRWTPPSGPDEEERP